MAKGHISIRRDECKGCQLCIKACPTGVLSLSTNFNKMGYNFSQYSGEGCTGCGVCYYTCPEPGAITVFKKWAEITETKYCEFCEKEGKIFSDKLHPEIKYCSVCLNVANGGKKYVQNAC